MSFARHTNTDVIQGANHPIIAGFFYNRETSAPFEYGIRPVDGSDFAEDAMHVVFVSDGSYRYARVLKTVAWVAVDENPDGSPVWERWEIKGHREYDIAHVSAAVRARAAAHA